MGHELPEPWRLRVFGHWAVAALAGTVVFGPVYGAFFATVLLGFWWGGLVAIGLMEGLRAGLLFIAFPAMVIAGMVGVRVTARTADVRSPEFETRVRRAIMMVLVALALPFAVFVLLPLALELSLSEDPWQVRPWISVLAFPVVVGVAVHVFSFKPIKVTRKIASGDAGLARRRSRPVAVVRVLIVGLAVVLAVVLSIFGSPWPIEAILVSAALIWVIIGRRR